MIQKELSTPPQPRIRLAKFVEIGCLVEAAVVIVQIEDAALADVEENTSTNTASVRSVRDPARISMVHW